MYSCIVTSVLRDDFKQDVKIGQFVNLLRSEGLGTKRKCSRFSVHVYIHGSGLKTSLITKSAMWNSVNFLYYEDMKQKGQDYEIFQIFYLI
jgi:hypothetical protein